MPRHGNPFQSPGELEQFLGLLEHVKSIDADSEGFGIELIGSPEYPTSEHLIYGRGGRKEIEVALPFEIWGPRARLWCQAIFLLSLCMSE